MKLKENDDFRKNWFESLFFRSHFITLNMQWYIVYQVPLNIKEITGSDIDERDEPSNKQMFDNHKSTTSEEEKIGTYRKMERSGWFWLRTIDFSIRVGE